MQIDGYIAKVEMADPERPRFLAGNAHEDNVKLVHFPQVYQTENHAIAARAVYLTLSETALREAGLWYKDGNPRIVIKPAAISY